MTLRMSSGLLETPRAGHSAAEGFALQLQGLTDIYLRVMKRSNLFWIGVASLLLFWFFTLRPGVFGGPATYIIVSGSSMEPILHDGDLVILHAQKQYLLGDIVAFSAEGRRAIHRIVGRDSSGFIVQGDNKVTVDPWRPSSQDILGRMWARVPRGGQFIVFARQPFILGGVAGIIGMLYVLGQESDRRSTKTRPVSHLEKGFMSPKAVEQAQPPGSPEPSVSDVARLAGGRSDVVRWPTPRATMGSTDGRPLTARELLSSAREDGRLRLLCELPKGARVYLEGEGGNAHWRIVTRSEPG